MHLKVVNSMTASGLSCKKHLVDIRHTISLLLCMNGLRKQSSGHVGPFISGSEAVFSLWSPQHWPTAVTIKAC